MSEKGQVRKSMFSVQNMEEKDLQKLTGYIRGGVTALAAKKTCPVHVDDTIELFELISISAGIRGTQILLAPADFVRATKGAVAPLAHAKPLRQR
jgi:Cys-tRNA(Pro)/Cys-tRNA(Cys) deacylase